MTGEEAARRAAGLEAAGDALRALPIDEVVEAVAAACARFADPADRARRDAEEALSEHHAAPRPAAASILDAAFPRWDAAALRGWLESDLGDRRALDRFVEIGGALRRARGPRLLLMIQARGIPTTPVADLMAGLLVKAPVWIKPAAGSDDLAERFAAVLDEDHPTLGAAVAVAGWEPGSAASRAALEAADVVSATGGAEAMAAIREAAGPGTRVVLHGPRLSAAAIGGEALEEDRGGALAALADDVALAGQLGCLSPVVAWVEAEAAEVHALAEPLLAALVARWPGRARKEAPPAERSAWAEWTALAAVEAAAGVGGPTAGGAEAGWTVRTRARAAAPDPPPVPRAIALEPVGSLEEVARLCGRRRGTVATVGVRAAPERVEALAPLLAEAGVERIAPLGEMQRPPPGWRRDGRLELADLVEWTDWEPGGEAGGSSNEDRKGRPRA